MPNSLDDGGDGGDGKEVIRDCGFELNRELVLGSGLSILTNAVFHFEVVCQCFHYGCEIVGRRQWLRNMLDRWQGEIMQPKA